MKLDSDSIDITSAIQEVRDRGIAAVVRLHDDYVQTGRLWQELLQRDRYNLPPFVVHNLKTGTQVADKLHWVEMARASQVRIRVRTFKDLVSQLELFIAALLKLWLTRFPEIVEEKSVTLTVILNSNDLAQLRLQAISEAVDSAILDRMKEKPARWFFFLKRHLGCTLGEGHIARFVERKAARDVLEHHDGLVDISYVQKAGAAGSFAVGDLFEPNDKEIDLLYDLVVGLINQIAADAGNRVASFGKEPAE